MKFSDTLRAQADSLRAEKATLIAEADTLTVDETRDVATVNARADEIIARCLAIDTETAAIDARADQLDALDAARDTSPKGPTFLKTTPKVEDASDVRNMSNGQLVDAVTRSIEDRGIDPTGARQRLTRHLRSATPELRQWAQNIAGRSTDVYESAFQKYLTGRENMWTAEERVAMTVGSNTNGGFLVPTHLDPTIVLTNTGSVNPVRMISRVVDLPVGNTWNGVTSAGVTASWDAEAVEVSDDTPGDYARVSVPVYLGRAFLRASYESFEDIAGLSSDVLMLFADARDRLEGAAHCVGSGSTAPTGVFTALDANTNVEVTSTTAATIGLVDLQGLKRAVGIRWRTQGSWLYNPTWGDAIKALGTALSASYSTDITQANTQTLLGRPVYESDNAPATTTTTALDNRIVFGDFSNYLIVDKPGSAAIEFIPQLFSTTTNLPDSTRGWIMHWRTGADSINDLAFRLLQDKTSA